MDVNAGYSVGNNLRVSMVVKNLTNTEYMGRPGDIQPQRSFSLRLSGQFWRRTDALHASFFVNILLILQLVSKINLNFAPLQVGWLKFYILNKEKVVTKYD